MAHITVKDARILFRNFSGKPTKFNSAGGKRTFCLVLPDDLAAQLEADGWNVKQTKPFMDQEPERYIQVEVGYKGRPPRVVTITGEGKTQRKTDLTEETVGMLDYAEIKRIDLTINPYHWEVSGSTGVKAYLRSMFVTLVEDELEEMYADPGYGYEEPADAPWVQDEEPPF